MSRYLFSVALSCLALLVGCSGDKESREDVLAVSQPAAAKSSTELPASIHVVTSMTDSTGTRVDSAPTVWDGVSPVEMDKSYVVSPALMEKFEAAMKDTAAKSFIREIRALRDSLRRSRGLNPE